MRKKLSAQDAKNYGAFFEELLKGKNFVSDLFESTNPHRWVGGIWLFFKLSDWFFHGGK